MYLSLGVQAVTTSAFMSCGNITVTILKLHIGSRLHAVTFLVPTLYVDLGLRAVALIILNLYIGLGDLDRHAATSIILEWYLDLEGRQAWAGGPEGQASEAGGGLRTPTPASSGGSGGRAGRGGNSHVKNEFRAGCRCPARAGGRGREGGAESA